MRLLNKWRGCHALWRGPLLAVALAGLLSLAAYQPAPPPLPSPIAEADYFPKAPPSATPAAIAIHEAPPTGTPTTMRIDAPQPPVATATSSPTQAAPTDPPPQPTPVPEEPAQGSVATVLILHTNDTVGYLDPCG